MRRALFTCALALSLVARGSDARAGGAACGGEPVDAGDGGADAGLCPASEYCGLPDGGAILDGAAGTCAPLSCGAGRGACPVNVYCASPDGGAILDGAAGVCQLEPCVASSDCTDPNTPICDTSQTPFACVECISGADCPGVLVCDTSTHTCVNPPDASAPDGGALDGSADGSSSDAGEPGDAAAVDAEADAAGRDAGSRPDASIPVVDAGPPETGSLDGGAWDCGLARESRASFGALAIPFALAALFVARRRRRARRA